MTMTDTVADMITRIRNGNLVAKSYVMIPHSNFKEEILKVLKEENFIKDYEIIEEGKAKYLKTFLLSFGSKKAITEIKKASKPGRRIYVDKDNIPEIKSGYGIAIISTSKGIMSSKKAKEIGEGGEILFYVW
ncbi:MAG: 30S ribosomal protein S8 [Candidatus Ratteibacteria bacterium]|nr:30S ribosomal protein S8 [Candidatus Ratteibacteria bacterium]